MKRIVSGLLIVALSVIPAYLFAQEAAAPVAEEEKEYNFGDFSSKTLTSKSWQALEVKDSDAVIVYTNKCVSLYKGKAQAMQASLTGFAPKGSEFDYWALNDVGVCLYIKVLSLIEDGKKEEAKEILDIIINDYSYAQCWDPKGWFWKVADAAKDKRKLIELEKTTGVEYDFGDYTSQTLTTKAWEVLAKNDYAGVSIYTQKCIDLYASEAAKQQGGLKEYLPKDKAFNAWALNDVGTCYFIRGESLMAEKKYKEAKEAYKTIIDKLSFAQCWDPRGWFWKPAVAARGKMNKLIAEQGV